MTKAYEDKMYVEALVLTIAEKLDRLADKAGFETNRTYVQDLEERFHSFYRALVQEIDLTTERAEELQEYQEQYDKIVDTLKVPEDQWFASELQFDNVWDNVVPFELTLPEGRMSLTGPDWFKFCKELIEYATELKITDAENSQRVLESTDKA